MGLALLVLASGVVAPRALADHEDGVYELPGFSMYNEPVLSVLVVPPNHGQLFNFETGILNDGDPNELTPFNSYLPAIENAIQAWEDAVMTLGSESLRAAYQVDVYVLGRDELPQDVLTDPDILVVTDEDQGFSLGTAVRVIPCIVRMSKYELLSFTYADMYNVTAQEFGHCLGLQHVGSQAGVDPTSEQKHPEHDVMNGFYTHLIGDEGTHLHCISNLDILALEWTMGHVNVALLPTGGPGATVFVPVDSYGDTCDPPPNDWRTYASTLPDTPEPEPSPSGSPQPTPSEEPVEEPGEEPDEEWVTTSITSPSDKASMPRMNLKRIAGTTTGAAASNTSVYVALAKLARHGCRWWVSSSRSFRSGDCSEPVWNDADGDTRWKLRTGGQLPAGRYRAMSVGEWAGDTELCCERGRNLVHFRLT